jgi:DNA adenine methylase
MQKVNPIKPVAPWLGGKSKLSEIIIEKINAIEHQTYAEAFIGMGGVFLRRDYVPKGEVINDYSKEVSNFFRILQRHYVAFLEMMKFQLTTRSEFERLKKTNPDTLTDLERAARFLYLQKTAYGGKCSEQAFGVQISAPARFDITKLQPMLEDLHVRLSSVIIECLNYSDFIEKYDTADTLFYADPPYWDCESDYGKGMFSKNDFVRLSNLFAKIEGKFIMSINDTPEIRRLFSTFHIMPVETVYSVGGGATTPAKELLISNVDLASLKPKQKGLFSMF